MEIDKITDKNYKDYLQRFKPRAMTECPTCKKQTVLWKTHELKCDHCGTHIGCND